jgi:hypothetical protein
MGVLSLSAVREIAHCNFLDGFQHKDIQDLASLGDWGCAKTHILREFRQRFLEFTGIIVAFCTLNQTSNHYILTWTWPKPEKSSQRDPN